MHMRLYTCLEVGLFVSRNRSPSVIDKKGATISKIFERKRTKKEDKETATRTNQVE